MFITRFSPFFVTTPAKRWLKADAKLTTTTISRERGAYLFNNWDFVKRLQPAFTKPQAVIIAHELQLLLQEEINRLYAEHLAKAELDRRSHQLKRTFTEMKTELQLLHRNDVAKLRNDHSRVISEIDRRRQRIREDVASVRTEMSVELNTRKVESREELRQRMDKAKELEERWMIGVAGVKTQMEATKWEATRNGLSNPPFNW